MHVIIQYLVAPQSCYVLSDSNGLSVGCKQLFSHLQAQVPIQTSRLVSALSAFRRQVQVIGSSSAKLMHCNSQDDQGDDEQVPSDSMMKGHLATMLCPPRLGLGRGQRYWELLVSSTPYIYPGFRELIIAS